MTFRTVRRLAPLIAGCVLISSCYVATHYDGWRYQGGPIINNGLFARPRYKAPLPAIPCNVPGTYEYSFSRFPDDDAVVMLTTPSAPAVSTIKALTTKVHLRVIDDQGQIKCDAAGFPGGKGNEQLVVTSSAAVLGLWHMKCATLPLRTCNPCRLQVVVGPVDPSTPAILVVPTLHGGGIELP